MEIQAVKLKLNGKKLIGFDFNSEYEYLGLTNSSEIITPFNKFEIKANFKFPIIRIIDDENFLVINTRTEKDRENCYVLDYKGQLINKYYFGDGIEDVKIIKNNIIVSYFDEGVLGKEGPNNNGLCVYDISGNLKFGYNEIYGQSKILDCYCMSKIGNKRIMFSAYTDFNLIELNLENFEETTHQLPKNLFGSNAMTALKNKAYFHSPYSDNEGIYEWELGKEFSTKIGDFKGSLIGLNNGRFLNFGSEEFTVITLS